MSPNSPRTSLVFLSGLAVLFGMAGPALLSAQDERPVFLSETGGGVSWTDVDEMIAAAQAGNPAARFHYAVMLEEGLDGKVPRDPEQALAIFRKLAADGDHEALFRLGKIAHDGLLGQPRDYGDAMALYRRAAAGGNNTAMHNVGAMYVSGRGVKRDYVEGLAWLMLAAENGLGEASVEQVRHRLRKYPERIAAAERRLPLLKAELAELNPAFTASVATPASVPAPLDVPKPARDAGVPPPRITPDATSPALPSLAPASPSIGVPKISIPPPTPAPEPVAPPTTPTP